LAVKQTLLRMMLVAGVLLVGVHRLPARDREGEAEAVALLKQVQALQKAGKKAEAVKVQEKLVEKVKAVFGPTSTIAAAQMSKLAELYHWDMGASAKAESLFRRCLDILEAKLGKDHPKVAASLNNLALLYQETGAYTKAEPLFLRSLAIRESKLGQDHPEVAVSLNNLASLYQAMGAFAKAEPLYRRCLQIREAKLGKDHPDVAGCLNDLAWLYCATGRYAKAELLFRRSLEIWEATLGKGHPFVATSLNNLANLYRDTGAYAKAEPLYRRSLEIRESRLGKDHPDVATSLNNLAQLYQGTGTHAKAEPLLLRSLEIYESRLGKDHPLVATSLSNLASLYWQMGQYAKAEPLYRRSLEIKESRLGKGHPLVAASLNNLANLYKDTGAYAKAESLYRRSLEIWEAKLGKDHPHVATTLYSMATLYDAMGAPAKAKPLLRRSLAIRESPLGKDHPEVAASLNELAVLCAATGESGKAFPLFDRARRCARRHLASVLPALSDAAKADFFRNTPARKHLEAALSLALAHKDDADVMTRSVTWLLNGKAIDQESLSSSVLMSRRSSDPALGKLSARLLAVRQQLARLTFTVPEAGQEKQRIKQIEELTGNEQELALSLRQSGSKAALPDWVELADVRKGLPADAVLIDVGHFNVFDFKASAGKHWQPARYAAWVTAKTGPVRLIDLGPADKIDAAVKQFRETVQAARKSIKADGEEKAEKALREHLDSLSALVLKPLLPHVGKAKRWLVSPDGNLWLFPWEALTLPDGKYAIEEHHISYLTSGRDLIPASAAKVKAGAPLVLADPDFDLDPAKAGAEARRLLGKAADEEATRALPGAFRLGTVKRLLATAGEAGAIAPSLKRYAGATPRVHTQTEALEAVFKAARSPRVLVLSTHGFFLPDQQAPRDEAGKPKPATRWENPLLRCGLLLAGCNNAAKATDGDDGVVTGLEVVGTDLRGTELVVLSACDTGVGEVRSGEGVSGLRQAFQLAGAQAVVSTLWQVPDKSSARLMTLFFDNLAKGQGKAEALRTAKLKAIEERRDDFAAAHPFFWAAFTLTGQP
jgi:CHAT domain-containing protein/Tfp pilus assembly protein PilF